MPRPLHVKNAHQAARYARKAESVTAPPVAVPAVGLVFLPVQAQGKTLAERVADACARFTDATGQAPTCIRVPLGTGYPPAGCTLRWDERRGIDPGWLWPGGGDGGPA
jgi:hypothetical protein